MYNETAITRPRLFTKKSMFLCDLILLYILWLNINGRHMDGNSTYIG